MVLSRGRLESQATACAQMTEAVLWDTFVGSFPADRNLSNRLRRNRQYGSRDRRLISTSVFAAFRWWGWLRAVAPPEFMARVKAAREGARPPGDGGDGGGGQDAPREDPRPPPLPRSYWSPLLLAAAVLDQDELPEAGQVWAGEARVSVDAARRLQRLADPSARLHGLAELLQARPMAGLRTEDLVPAWVPGEFEGERVPKRLAEWLQSRPPVWLRAQMCAPKELAAALRKDGLEGEQHARAACAFNVGQPRVNLRTLQSYRRGMFEIQDLASQSIGVVCAAKPGQRWWDACAGAGGKALLLASQMQGKGTVVATDKREYKLGDLRRRARRARFPNIRCKPWTGKPLPKKSRATFDGVLVDAPCSCSGTWRRNPDGRWTLSESELPELAALQSRLLHGAASGVRPGGVLVYATCSMFRCENQGVVEAFLAEHADFRLEPFPHPLQDGDCPGMLQMWPWDGDCDAMFVARFRRASDECE